MGPGERNDKSLSMEWREPATSSRDLPLSGCASSRLANHRRVEPRAGRPPGRKDPLKSFAHRAMPVRLGGNRVIRSHPNAEVVRPRPRRRLGRLHLRAAALQRAVLPTAQAVATRTTSARLRAHKPVASMGTAATPARPWNNAWRAAVSSSSRALGGRTPAPPPALREGRSVEPWERSRESPGRPALRARPEPTRLAAPSRPAEPGSVLQARPRHDNRNDRISGRGLRHGWDESIRIHGLRRDQRGRRELRGHLRNHRQIKHQREGGLVGPGDARDIDHHRLDRKLPGHRPGLQLDGAVLQRNKSNSTYSEYLCTPTTTCTSGTCTYATQCGGGYDCESGCCVYVGNACTYGGCSTASDCDRDTPAPAAAARSPRAVRTSPAPREPARRATPVSRTAAATPPKRPAPTAAAATPPSAARAINVRAAVARTRATPAPTAAARPLRIAARVTPAPAVAARSRARAPMGVAPTLPNAARATSA